jgi:hypothetical protein
MSYKLDPVTAPASAKTLPIVHRCSGLSWAASLAAGCFAEAAAPVPSPAQPAAATDAKDVPVAQRRPVAADAYTASETQSSSYALPVLGSPADARMLRAAGGKDAYIGSAKAVDLNFRFGSKYRVRSGDEGWDVFKFSDVTSENRTQSTGMKNLGVELLFPFQ